MNLRYCPDYFGENVFDPGLFDQMLLPMEDNAEEWI